MKIKTQTIVGFAVGIVLATSVVLLLPPPPTVYNSFTVDGNTLKNLYNGNFSKMNFNFVSSGTNKIDLQPAIYNSANTQIPIPAGLVRSLGTGTSITGSRVLDGSLYYLEHNRLPSHLLQLQTLVTIMTNNPGGHLDFVANPYSKIDPSDATHIYYQITPYKSDNSVISVGADVARALQLDPCPPARQY